MDKFYCTRLDSVLELFDKMNGNRIPSSVLLDEKDAPEDWTRAIMFLAAEGYLEERNGYFEITYKGKALADNGGFIRKHRRERVLFYCTVIAAVCGFAGLIVSLVALVCQING